MHRFWLSTLLASVLPEAANALAFPDLGASRWIWDYRSHDCRLGTVVQRVWGASALGRLCTNSCGRQKPLFLYKWGGEGIFYKNPTVCLDVPGFYWASLAKLFIFISILISFLYLWKEKSALLLMMGETPGDDRSSLEAESTRKCFFLRAEMASCMYVFGHSVADLSR